MARTRRAARALNKASLTCAAALSAVAGIGALGASSVARAEHIPYEIDVLGYNDGDHTSASGSRSNTVRGMNAAGHVFGQTTRFEASAATQTGTTAWTFQGNGMVRIGLFDGAYAADHIRNDLRQASTVQFFNNPAFDEDTDTYPAGVAAGHAERYFTTTPFASAGQSAWVYQNGQSDRIGLFGAATPYRRSDGFESSTVTGLSDHGHVGGYSERYAGGSANGNSAWINDPGSTASVNIDLPGSDYFRASDGFRDHRVQFVESLSASDAVVAGTSRRFDASGGNAGQAAWVYEGSHNRVGLTANNTVGQHTATNGTQSSTLDAMNAAGDVVGQSTRYGGATGNSERGRTAFIRLKGGTTTEIGMNDAEHTSADGSRTSQAIKLTNKDGSTFAIGSSIRYNGAASQMGQSAWRVEGTSTERIGLTDGAHSFTVPNTDPTVDRRGKTVQFSQGTILTDNGLVAGFSSRFGATGTDLGRSAWVYNNGPTQVGFFGDGQVDDNPSIFYKRNDDYRFSEVNALNEDGEAAGRSQRFLGSESRGYSAFFYTPSLPDPIRIGLYAGVHTTTNGTQESTPQLINEDGQVAGVSSRYDPTQANAVFRGVSGWFYDPVGDDTFELVFSTATNGTAITNISLLNDHGIVFGDYTLFSGNDALGQRAFLWDFNVAPGDRFHDLGGVVEGGLPDAMWSSLNSVTGVSDLGNILGFGTRNGAGGGGSMPYLLTPVPEPTGGVALLAFGGLALLPRRRR